MYNNEALLTTVYYITLSDPKTKKSITKPLVGTYKDILIINNKKNDYKFKKIV